MIILTWKIGTTYQKYIKTLMMLAEPGSFITTSANKVTCQAMLAFVVCLIQLGSVGLPL